MQDVLSTFELNEIELEIEYIAESSALGFSDVDSSISSLEQLIDQLSKAERNARASELGLRLL